MPALESDFYFGFLTREVQTRPVLEVTQVRITAELRSLGQSDTKTLTILPTAPSTVTFGAERVSGGQAVLCTVSLTGPAPAGGVVVDLVSDNPEILVVPPQVAVPPGEESISVPLFSSPLEASVGVTVTAQNGNGSASGVVTLDGPELIGFTLSQDLLYPGQPFEGTVRLGAPAPTGGTVVELSSDGDPFVFVPVDATVPEGAIEASFSAQAGAFSEVTGVNVFATLATTTLVAQFVLLSTEVEALRMSPPAIPGGSHGTGAVHLLGAAAPDGTTVQLGSEDPALVQLPESVVVPTGAHSESFPFATQRVREARQVQVWATVNGSTFAYADVRLVPPAKGDWDTDGDIDLSDFVAFQRCLSGADASAEEDCALVFDFDGDLDVDLADLLAMQGVYTGPGNGIPPATFQVDPVLVPAVAELPSLDGGDARPVATLTDGSGIQLDFVENELLITTDDREALEACITRWNGVLLRSFSPANYGLEGVTSEHLVRIDTTFADVSALPGDLRALDPQSRGPHWVSSQAGLAVICAAAREAVGGMDVGINYLHQSTAIAQRSTTDGATGPAGYVADAFQWPHFKKDSRTQDTGVAEAWRMINLMNGLTNSVNIAIIDGGFSTTTDTPNNPVYRQGNSGDPNPMNCGTPGSCPWHGTNVSDAAMGRVDNGFGAAGVAGPIANAILVKTQPDTAAWPDALGAAYQAGARIINMSFSARLPAALSAVTPTHNRLTQILRNAGTLLFAAAGNRGENVDAEDCFLVCWEEAENTPCENDGVICIGALDNNSRARAPYSNWGGDDVALFAPGTVYVGPDPASAPNTVQQIQGTSFASPFAAGVAALIWSANPRFSADDVEATLRTFTNPSSDGTVQPIVNAYAAVRRALGNVKPEVRIVTPVEGGFYAGGLFGYPLFFQAVATDDDDGFVPITWSSNINGVLGTGADCDCRVNLAFGNHIITATARDSGGAANSHSVSITVGNSAPRVDIVEPKATLHIVEGEIVFFRARSFDADSPGFTVPDANVRWISNLAVDLGTGHLLARSLPLGVHAVTANVTDAGGAIAASPREVFVVVNARPPINLSPTVLITRAEWVTYFPTGIDERGLAFTEFEFEGVAHDPETGPIVDDFVFTWFTNRFDLQNTFFGPGRRIRRPLYGLPGTIHEITLRVPDPGPNPGAAAVTRVTVTIPPVGPR